MCTVGVIRCQIAAMGDFSYVKSCLHLFTGVWSVFIVQYLIIVEFSIYTNILPQIKLRWELFTLSS